ncbi:hypothetical protein IUY40_16250 [Flavobacterium sp. ALJ2]|uniref:hypothetical protein n=1 Tax=Flavobacterium sp. ALJ2 TaxID=2786960 RepID=UPI00189FD4CC|nr:hypothetical protein [Flavobacterium sp. ALJ2]MBF7093085.1 hypothetical protein [Flavobacterium sp. ALJ2]
MFRSSSSGKYKNASSLGAKSPRYNRETGEWENTNVLAANIERRKINADIQPNDKDYLIKYPRFIRILKQLSDYVYNNENVFKWLSYYSGYSSTEVLNQLQYGKGAILSAEIMVTEYGQTLRDGSSIKINIK